MTYAAVPPFTRSGQFVTDATGSRVLVCGDWGICQALYNEFAVDEEGFFICPICGRLGQRMIEATAEQCGLSD